MKTRKKDEKMELNNKLLQKRIYSVLIYSVVILLLVLVTTPKVNAAHAVCGKVNNAVDGMDAAWRSVIIYNEGNKEKHVSCEIGPENNKYCCDSEGIDEKGSLVIKGAIGNIIFAEVLDSGDGYTARPVNTSITGAGYDVMPEMTLAEIITIHSPKHSIYIEKSILLNVSTLYNTIWYSLDSQENITLCTNCNHAEKMLDLDYGQHNIAVYVNDSRNKVYKKHVSFAIVSEINFSRKPECKKCEEHKAPPLTEINMTVTVNLSHAISSFILTDYYPNSWQIIDSANGTIESYSLTHNKIFWFVSRKEISKSYIIKSPERETPPIDYSFQSELDSHLSGQWQIKVTGASSGAVSSRASYVYENSIALSALSEKLGEESFIMYRKIEPEKPVVMSIDNENISIKRMIIEVENPVENVFIKLKKINSHEKEIYQYISFEDNLEDKDLKNVAIEFAVDKSWLDKNNYAKELIILKKYNEGNEGAWENLETLKLSEDENYEYYRTEIKDLSIFAVVAGAGEEKNKEEVTEADVKFTGMSAAELIIENSVGCTTFFTEFSIWIILKLCNLSNRIIHKNSKIALISAILILILPLAAIIFSRIIRTNRKASRKKYKLIKHY